MVAKVSEKPASLRMSVVPVMFGPNISGSYGNIQMRDSGSPSTVSGALYTVQNNSSSFGGSGGWSSSVMFGRSEHHRLLVRSRARVDDTRVERSMPRHRLRCDCWRRSCDSGNHGSARLFGEAIELDLWRCVYCATRRSSTPAMHQNLIQGRKRMEGG